MATKAAANRKRRRAPANDEDFAVTLPKRWWQWILIYPTLAISVFSASPEWFNSAKSWLLNVPDAQAAELQAQLWQKNRTCASLPSQGTMAGNVSLDATICNSGDILVHAVTPQRAEVFKWLPLADVVPAPAADSGGLIGAAHAATLSDRIQQSVGSTAKPVFQVAMFQVSVICTRLDGRYLHRRIQTPQGCFDEVIDTFTGALISRSGALCIAQC